ncbi:hypothetical protein AAZV13_15G160200 [Glycine max]|uniref:G protein gamma domain-containing protein n=1 Tax=Glycine max TaxID=3847 RepID=A0A0R0G2W0_SOYBN|eukprot:XP_006597873.1 guanine nucleotide-binding protein subunit gamma 3 isoform X2 [Glycine max]
MSTPTRGTSNTLLSLPLPSPTPKAPSGYPDLYRKRRETAKIQMLEREISFLEEELKSSEGLQPASRCCKEIADFVMANSDPLLPTSKKNHQSCSLWKCDIPCFNLSWICHWCCDGCFEHQNLSSCCSHGKPCNCCSSCLPSTNCSCCSNGRSHCCKDSCGCKNCCTLPSCNFGWPFPSCCICKCSCSCSCPKCPKVRPCCCCTNCCWNPCSCF